MRPRNWSILTLSLITLFSGLAILFGYSVDPYGIYHHVNGEHKVSYNVKPESKYLLNINYVPGNFDALIIGPSVSANWRLSPATGLHFYNESLMANNTQGESELLKPALAKRNFRAAIYVLCPRITNNHGDNEELRSIKPIQGIVSINALFDTVAELLRRHHHFHDPQIQFDGVIFPPFHKNLTNASTPHAEDDPSVIDPLALQQLRKNIEELQRKNIKVIYVIPPSYGKLYHARQHDIERWNQTILAQIPPAPVINFNSAAYEAFRNFDDNYYDYAHLTPQGGARLSEMISSQLPALLAQDAH